MPWNLYCVAQDTILLTWQLFLIIRFRKSLPMIFSEMCHVSRHSFAVVNFRAFAVSSMQNFTCLIKNYRFLELFDYQFLLVFTSFVFRLTSIVVAQHSKI